MKKIIFLDRDGVINKDPSEINEYSYVTKPEELLFLPGSIEAVKKLNDAGYEIILISNQGGISRGFFTLDDLDRINAYMINQIEKGGGRILKAYYCPHQTSDNCECKKPKTGLFRKAEEELGIKVKDTYFIGDGIMDIEAGHSLGLKTVLLLSGKTAKDHINGWKIKPDYIFNDLFNAVNYIVKGEAK